MKCLMTIKVNSKVFAFLFSAFRKTLVLIKVFYLAHVVGVTEPISILNFTQY